jgi:hypothetical protein
MKVIKIEDNVFTHKKSSIKGLNKSNLYCIDLELIELLNRLEYPIKKEFAIERMVKFIQYFISNMDNYTMNINSDILIDIFTRDHYKKYITLLSDNNIIQCIRNENGQYYTIGEKSKRYSLYGKWRDCNDLCLVMFDKKISLNKIINENIKELNLDNRMINTVINKLSVDYESAIKAEIDYYINSGSSLSNLRKRINRLLETKIKRYIKKGYKVHRVYHSFSNLSRVSREYLNIKMNNIDLKNSQPLLLVSYLKENGYDIDLNYQKDCEEGNFYEQFYHTVKEDANDDKDIWRNNVKIGLYKSIYFNFNDKSPYNKRFMELYPSTYTSIKFINDREENLACLLQNREAELFNNLKLKSSKYYFTLFDAIYFDDKKDILDILEQINDFFKRNGIKVKTEIKIK